MESRESAVAYRETVPDESVQSVITHNVETYIGEMGKILQEQTMMEGDNTSSDTFVSFVYNPKTGSIVSLKKRPSGFSGVGSGYSDGSQWAAFVVRRTFVHSSQDGIQKKKLRLTNLEQ